MTSFTVPGRPVAKQRPRIGWPKGRDGRPDRSRRPFLYPPADTVAYERAVGLFCLRAFREPLTGPVKVTIRLYCHGRHADADNYAKAILDGAKGRAFLDDRQVVRLDVSLTSCGSKGDERAEVEIEEIEEAGS